MAGFNIICIKRKADDPITKHFNENTHNYDNVKIVGIEKIKL